MKIKLINKKLLVLFFVIVFFSCKSINDLEFYSSKINNEYALQLFKYDSTYFYKSILLNECGNYQLKNDTIILFPTVISFSKGEIDFYSPDLYCIEVDSPLIRVYKKEKEMIKDITREYITGDYVSEHCIGGYEDRIPMFRIYNIRKWKNQRQFTTPIGCEIYTDKKNWKLLNKQEKKNKD